MHPILIEQADAALSMREPSCFFFSIHLTKAAERRKRSPYQERLSLIALTHIYPDELGERKVCAVEVPIAAVDLFLKHRRAV